MDLAGDAAGYALTVANEDGFHLFGQGCPAVGVPRTVLLTFTEPVDAPTITMVRG